MICSGDEDYGTVYCQLLEYCTDAFVLNLMEDHFCVMDSVEDMEDILNTMKAEKIDVLKATFHKIEQNSMDNIAGINATGGLCFNNNEFNFRMYNVHYGKRYYIGCNFITTKSFAHKFWNRKLGQRPHGYEIVDYSFDWEHRVMIPAKEVLASIDDAHGEAGTDLLSRDNEKFKKIYDSTISHTVL